MKKLTLEEIDRLQKPEFSVLLNGWMMAAAKNSPKIRQEIEACANFSTEIDGKKYDNSACFHSADGGGQ